MKKLIDTSEGWYTAVGNTVGSAHVNGINMTVMNIMRVEFEGRIEGKGSSKYKREED